MQDEDDQEKLQHRPARIKTDGQGRSVWADPIETIQLKLVSTQQLQDLLASDDEAARSSVVDAARTGNNGVLARDATTGLFEIIDDFNIQAVLAGDLERAQKIQESAAATLEPVGAENSAASDELSLVTTQMLRKVLHTETDADLEFDDDDTGGFDPYNSR